MISNQFTHFMTILPLFANSVIFLQAYKVYYRQSHDDISFITIIFSVFNTLMWSIYGYMLKNTPLIISGLTAFIGFLLMFYFKITIPSKENGMKYL